MLYLAIYVFGWGSSFLKQKIVFFYIFLISIMLLAVFRYGVGPDYFAYMDMYMSTQNYDLYGNASSLIKPTEFIFGEINSLFRSLGLSYQTFTAFMAIFSLIFISLTALKYSDNPTLSLVIYYSAFYFVWTYSGIRQGLVASIGIYYLIECKSKNQNLKFIIINIILFFIHNTALFLFFFYIFSKIRITPYVYIFLLILSILSFFIIEPFFLKILTYFPLYERVAVYITSNSNFFDFKGITRIIFMILFGVVFVNKDFLSQTKNLIIYNLFMLNFLVYFPLRHVEILAQNLSVYGFISLFLLLPNILKNLKMNINIQVYQTIIVVLMFFFLVKNLHSMAQYAQMKNYSFFIPYTNIFSSDCDDFNLCKSRHK